MSGWKAHCPDCHIDDEFTNQEHASELVVYHNSLFDCSGDAIVEEL